MKYQIGDYAIGTVNNVRPYALFLTFEDGVEGLLHISEISDSYIRDIEKFGTIGDQIKVKILSIDKANGFLRTSLKQVPQEEAYTTHRNIRGKAPDLNDEDFLPLEQKLNDWIEATYKKAKGESEK